MDSIRVLLTGCNRGLGKDLLKLLITKNPQYSVLATTRKNIQELQESINKQYSNNNVQIAELDLIQNESIEKLFLFADSRKYKFDAIINNGAFGCDWGNEIPTFETASTTMKANLIGTINLTHRFLPLLKDTGRVINVSSKLAALRFQGDKIQQLYSKEGLSKEDILEAASTYPEKCQKKNLDGYFQSSYGTSKMLLNYWARFILPKSMKNQQMSISMSPGHCKTDMGGEKAIRSSMDGAISIYNHLEGEYKADVFYHTGSEYNFYDCGQYIK